MLVELIKKFCNENEECTYRDDYSGKFMFGRKCVGVVIKEGYSYMEVMMNLTQFLTAEGFEDEDGELLGASVDELGMDMILYFPSMNMDNLQ